jgi:hypothetical protein
LWKELLDHYHIKIHFAHRTFQWSSEARGKAAVHCVIIGFAAFDAAQKYLYDYDNPKSEPHEVAVGNINPYLIEGGDFTIIKRSKPICNVPEIKFGSQPNDSGHLILLDEEKNELLSKEPLAEKFIKPLIGAYEYINGIMRWCIWLKGFDPNEYREIKPIMSRIAMVEKVRLESKRPVTRELAKVPSLFGFISQPDTNYLLIPRVSSENRRYIPLGFLSCDVIAADSCLTIPNATIYHFGVLTSAMHMEWMRQVCGRLESRYRYSNTLVYNNFPWANPTPAQIKNIEEKAKGVLDARAQFPNSTLADLYDPLTMPPALLKAHQALDKEVDKAYRKEKFNSERERIEYLFTLYQQLDQPLLPSTPIKKGRKKL